MGNLGPLRTMKITQSLAA